MKRALIKAPNSKLQRSSKFQIPNTKHQTPNTKLEAGAAWSLELGFWCFDSGISLELLFGHFGFPIGRAANVVEFMKWGT
jgi:hypothetical protein